MRCPTCPDETLVMTERSGIEIDYCTACRGVWLDRGELDKIIDRSVSEAAAARPRPVLDRGGIDEARRRERSRDDRFDDDRFDDDRDGRRPGRRRRESLLGELFDF